MIDFAWILNRLVDALTLRTPKLITAGDAARDAGRWQDAAASYHLALARRPELGGVWVQYGHALRELGDDHGAEAAYAAALRRCPDDADAALHRGHAALRLGRRRVAAESYVIALRGHPASQAARDGLLAAGWSRRRVAAVLAAAGAAMPPPAGLLPRPVASIAFDITDLLDYLSHARRPTGIQRVQLSVIRAALERPSSRAPVQLVGFSRGAKAWIEIPPEVFRSLAEAMAAPGSPDVGAMGALQQHIQSLLLLSPVCVFAEGTALVDLGSSWAHADYALAVRTAQVTDGIVYIPFVHDMLPILMPHYFVPDLVAQFAAWAEAILAHADGFLVNSQATAHDLTAVAARYGRTVWVREPVRLDATFDPAGQRLTACEEAALLSRHGLAGGDYILFVATMEPRKNHDLAFAVWEEMIATRGEARTPVLVCVGGRGWLNAAPLARLAGNAALGRRVLLVRDIADIELETLYRRCLFTVYPSQHEGWGLPVTESLSFGRVPVTARSSALPESGGTCAVYFEPGSRDDFRAAVERLIDDTGYRDACEAAIRRTFRPRSWAAIADDIVARAVDVVAEAVRRPHRHPAPALSLDQVYGLRRAQAAGGSSGLGFRHGVGWSEPGTDGCWLTSEGECAIWFALEPGSGRSGPLQLRLQVCAAREDLDGSRLLPSVLEVRDRDGATPLAVLEIAGGDQRWLGIDLPQSLVVASDVYLRLRVTGPDGVDDPLPVVAIAALQCCAANADQCAGVGAPSSVRPAS